MYMYEEYGLETKYHDERVRASKYFVERYVEKLEDGKYCVISDPKEEGLNIKNCKVRRRRTCTVRSFKSG